MNTRTHFAIGLGMAVIVILLKFAAGPDVGFSAVALLPVAYVTWFVSRSAGLTVAAGSAAGLFFANARLLHRYPNTGMDFWNALMDLVVFVVVAWSLSETRRQYRRVQQLAREDPLTGLLNRRAFLEAVHMEILRARRERVPVTLAYMDLDNFKALNDTFGHAAGDRCLKTVAYTLKHVIRNVDVAARLGGDEFGVLLTSVRAASPAAVLGHIADSMRNAHRDGCGETSLSIGAVTFTAPEDDPQTLIRAADDALYNAKRSGKNRVVHEWR